jgi:hypothetical protein
MSINKTRGFLYGLSRLLGDVNAVKKGTVRKRIVRKGSWQAPVQDEKRPAAASVVS